MSIESEISYYIRLEGYTENFAESMLYFLAMTPEDEREKIVCFILFTFRCARDNTLHTLSAVDGRTQKYHSIFERQRRDSVKRMALKYLQQYEWKEVNPDDYEHILYERIFSVDPPLYDTRDILDGILIGHIRLQDLIVQETDNETVIAEEK